MRARTTSQTHSNAQNNGVHRNNGTRKKINRELQRRKALSHGLGMLGIQMSVKVGASNDKHEVQANKVAEQVMNESEPTEARRMIGRDADGKGLVRKMDDNVGMKPMVQSKCKTCDGDSKGMVSPEMAQRRSKGRAFIAGKHVSENVAAIKNSAGQPLAREDREFLEPRFGRDLGHVRIHNNDLPAKTSEAIQAKAFTVGNDVAFNKGYYRPGTHEGRSLLAHEITHTFQQTGGKQKGATNTGVNRDIAQRQPSQTARARYLRNYMSGNPLSILDSEIQITEEYKSFVSPRYVWRLNNTEAIYACRLILRHMKAGNRVNWRTDARRFAAEARRVYGAHNRALNSTSTSRGLTSMEIAEAQKVFHGSIDYSKVKLEFDSTIAEAGSIINGGGGMGVTLFNTIKFNRKLSTAPGNSDMAWLIHELTHVAQAAKTGATYIFQAVWAQWTEGYAYNPQHLRTRKFKDFNREQQGEIASDYYRYMLYSNTKLRLTGITRADFLPRIIELRNGNF